MKKAIAALSALALCASMVSCGRPGGAAETPAVNTKDLSGIEDNTIEYEGYRTVAETDALKLEFSGDEKDIRLTDKRSGHAWLSMFDAGELDYEANDLWLANIKTLFNLVYINKSAKVNETQTASLYGDANNTFVTRLENGFQLDVFFLDVQIGVEIRFTLENDALNVFIPENAITETGDNKLVGIYVLPFLGAANDKADGYYVYPSGLGELYRFKPKSERQNSVMEYRLPVYADTVVDMEEITSPGGPYAQRPAVLLPIYGVKVSDSAFMANIIDGQYNSAVHVLPSGIYVGANRIFAEFVYRNHYDRKTDSAGAGEDSRKYVANLYDVNLIPGDRSMRFTFLSGDKANYGAMAGAYREYLQKTGRLNRSIEAGDKIPVSLDVVGGILKKYFFFKQFVPLTTFDQVRAFADALKESGVDSAVFNLEGWSKTGLEAYPQSFAFEGRVGSAGSLKKLAESCRGAGYRLMLGANLFDLDSKVGGFQMARDAAIDQSFSQYVNAAGNRFLMNPRVTAQDNAGLVEKFGASGIDGFTYARLGEYIFGSSNKSGASTRRQTAELYGGVLERSRARFGGAAAEGGNAYVLKDAALVKNLPLQSDMLALSDMQIPLYPMVVHGSVDYTSSPVNLYYDSKTQLLKLMEYGFTPHFMVSGGNSRLLKDSTYNWLFTSQFSVWEREIVRVYKEFNEKLGMVYASKMTNYEKLSPTLSRVTYENAVVYFNYADEAALCGGQTVPPENLLVVAK